MAENKKKEFSYKQRINPKTQLPEYKVRFYFYTNGGTKRHDSETAWLPSLEQAREVAQRTKEAKEKEDRKNMKARRDMFLETAFSKFCDVLEEKANEKKDTTSITYQTVSNTIKNKYFPTEIKKTRVRDVTSSTFRQWLTFINEQENLGGKSVRQQKTILNKFNTWLAENNFYLADSLDVEVELGLKRVKIKPVKEHNKEDAGKRNILTLMDIWKIQEYYHNADVGIFHNLYWNTLFYVLFFGGLRVEELVALQWKNIDLKMKLLAIKNAISDKEPTDAALERIENGIYKTKNATSIRQIPILKTLTRLLSTYRRYYLYRFGLDEDKIADCFVFPNLTTNDPHIYQKHKNILRELNKVCKAQGIPKTDSQMLRHSSATFLIMPPPQGLGFNEGEVKYFFGHKDTSMLQHIYAKLNAEQATIRLMNTFKDMVGEKVEPVKTADDILKEKIINSIKSKDDTFENEIHATRMLMIMERALNDGIAEFFYYPDEQYIVDKFLSEHLTSSMIFTKITV